MKIKLTEQQFADLTQKIINAVPEDLGSDIDMEKDAPNLSKLIKTIMANKNAGIPTPTSVATDKIKNSIFNRNKQTPNIKFAENIPSGSQMMHPLGHKEQITSLFGQRNTNVPGASKNHEGVDISAKSGSSVYAPLDGVVLDARDTTPNACGGFIRLEHINIETKFCHLSRINVNVGDKVKKGQIIGRTGGGPNDPMHGVSTGPHLHYEILNKSGVAMNPTSVEPNLV